MNNRMLYTLLLPYNSVCFTISHVIIFLKEKFRIHENAMYSALLGSLPIRQNISRQCKLKHVPTYDVFIINILTEVTYEAYNLNRILHK